MEPELFNLQGKAKVQNALSQAAAISKSQAVIEFNLDGTIITANQNFLSTLGYSLAEIKGKHHSMFVEPAVRDSNDYANSGPSSTAASFSPPNTSGSARAANRYGFRPPTIRSMMPRASHPG
jgi:PAS domain-containing protein